MAIYPLDLIIYTYYTDSENSVTHLGYHFLKACDKGTD